MYESHHEWSTSSGMVNEMECGLGTRASTISKSHFFKGEQLHDAVDIDSCLLYEMSRLPLHVMLMPTQLFSRDRSSFEYYSEFDRECGVRKFKLSHIGQTMFEKRDAVKRRGIS